MVPFLFARKNCNPLVKSYWGYISIYQWKKIEIDEWISGSSILVRSLSFSLQRYRPLCRMFPSGCVGLSDGQAQFLHVFPVCRHGLAHAAVLYQDAGVSDSKHRQVRRMGSGSGITCSLTEHRSTGRINRYMKVWAIMKIFM